MREKLEMLKNNENGYLLPSALVIIFSLSIFVLSFCMFTFAFEKRINSSIVEVSHKKEIEKILFNILDDFNLMCDEEVDSEKLFHIQKMIFDYSEFNLSIREVSTGLNKHFLKRDFLESAPIKKYVECNEKVFTDFTWINQAFCDKKIIEEVTTGFNKENIFPLVNDFPLLNIHFMSEEFLRAVLNHFEIKKAEEKIFLLNEKLTDKTSLEDISKILNISLSHPFFLLVGTKSTFWEITFETEKCKSKAIYAGLPEYASRNKIEKYILLKKEIIYKRRII